MKKNRKKALKPEEIDLLEKTANLQLTSKERSIISHQVQEALDAISTLKELNTKNTKPLAHPTGLRNVTREDVITSSLSQKEALSGADRTHDGFFVVDAILDHR